MKMYVELNKLQTTMQHMQLCLTLSTTCSIELSITDVCKEAKAQGSEWSNANATMHWLLLQQSGSFTYGCGPYSISCIWVNSKGKASFVCNQQQVSVPARQQQKQVMHRQDSRRLAIQVTQTACCTDRTPV